MDEIIKFTNKELDIKSDLIAISTLRPWINAGRVGSIALNKLKNTTNAKLVGSLKNPGSFFDFTRYRPRFKYTKDKRNPRITVVIEVKIKVYALLRIT